jgi:hypothetical protein
VAISIHGAIQIYNPIVDPHDTRYGLNPWHNLINVALFIVPNILASLAFIGPNGGYAPDGSVCWLPIRPVWYSLALSWIPRYVIFVIITSLAIAVYSHVGNQFKSFHRSWNLHFKPSKSPKTVTPKPRAISNIEDGKTTKFSSGNEPITLSPAFQAQSNSQLLSPFVPLAELSTHQSGDIKGQRRYTTDKGSTPAHRNPFSLLSSKSLPSKKATIRHSSACITTLETDNQSPEIGTCRRISVATNGTCQSGQTQKSSQTMPIFNSPSDLSLTNLTASPSVNAEQELEQGLTNLSVGQSALEVRRQTMIKQLKTTFIYPMVYIALWTIPFVLHCMQYRTEYAMNPPSALAALSTCSIASMGLFDAACFLVRERPWVEVGLWPRRYRRSSSQPTISDAPSWQTRLGNNHDTLPENTGMNGTGMRIEAQGTRRSSASSSYSSRLGSSPWEYSAQPTNSMWKYGNGSSSKPWNAKSQAIERLAIERSDRAKRSFEKQMAESLEMPTGSSGRIVTPLSKPRTADRNWWDSEYMASFEGGNSEDDHRITYGVPIPRDGEAGKKGQVEIV